MLGEDPAMTKVLALAEGVAMSQATVLIQGESGTGKELLARFIHSRSPRGHRPFIAVNCAALPDGLLESELFGHERGAFTGALMRKIGKFEMAHQGTILLDEISEMNLGLQAKLLRVLQEREVDRIGGREPVQVNIRVIATTNRSLRHEVEQGRFREDLYYRLAVMAVHVPPLRARQPEDLLALLEAIVYRAANQIPDSPRALAEPVTDRLVRYPWPGNLREMRNVVERAMLSARGAPRVLWEHLPAEVRDPLGSDLEYVPRTIADVERIHVERTLRAHRHNRTRAAEALGISRATLIKKIKEYGLGPR